MTDTTGPNPSQSSSSPSSPPSPHTAATTLLWTGISQDSPSTVRRALADIQASKSSSSRRLNITLLNRALNAAVKQTKPNVVRFLLDETEVKAEDLAVSSVGMAAREAGEGDVEEVLEALVQRGWDLNAGEDGGQSSDGQHPIYQVCHSERLIRWFLSHGARLTFSGPDVRFNPPLLEVVARRGTVATFKLLMDSGAPRGLRCLHSAVEVAAFAERDKELEKEAQRMKMVRFLLEEIGCNVNGMDVPEGLMPGGHYGTPLNYAAHTGGGERVVRYLLDNGADPTIKDCYGVGDALTFAKGNGRVIELLTKWKEENNKNKT